MSTDALTFGRLRAFSSTDQSMLLVSIVCSIIYFVTLRLDGFQGSVFFKALSIAPLAVLAFKLLNRPENLILGSALSFSCLGDIFLDLGSSKYFINGLISFLIAHLIYIALFGRNWKRPLRPDFRQIILTAVVLIFSLALSDWLAPSLGDLANPVMIYICAITVMVVASILANFARPWIWIGAILFLISDSIIAVNRFKNPLPLRDFLVWSTYYIGQYCIAVGFLREKLGEPFRKKADA